MAVGDVETVHEAGCWSVRIQGEEDTPIARFETKEAAIETGRQLAATRAVKHIIKDLHLNR